MAALLPYCAVAIDFFLKKKTVIWESKRFLVLLSSKVSAIPIRIFLECCKNGPVVVVKATFKGHPL